MENSLNIPIENLFQISEKYPRALAAYILCWQHADSDLSCLMTREFISVDKSMSWAKFYNDIKSLARLGLLEWFPKEDCIHITLVGLEIDAEGYNLC